MLSWPKLGRFSLHGHRPGQSAIRLHRLRSMDPSWDTCPLGWRNPGAVGSLGCHVLSWMNCVVGRLIVDSRAIRTPFLDRGREG